MLDKQMYIEHVYRQSSTKPWLIFFGKTPYGGPDGDFNIALILLKRVACTKKAFGDQLNVAIVDIFMNEHVREAFDPDISRAGSGAPLVVLVKNGSVYHVKQGNHDGKFLARLVQYQEGLTIKRPIPYPLNSVTIYWEYIK